MNSVFLKLDKDLFLDTSSKKSGDFVLDGGYSDTTTWSAIIDLGFSGEESYTSIILDGGDSYED